ncbi:MAG: GNAT family N-acetyltransferase [Rudaea sp.]|nr:GNAT family N-acetyltransferase [Rudaea sp.]
MNAAKLQQVVRDNAAQERYEMQLDGGVAFVTYRRSPDAIVLLHAEVPRELEGRGLGSTLVRSVLEAVRANGEKIVPRCSFIAAYLRRHPEFADLLAD